MRVISIEFTKPRSKLALGSQLIRLWQRTPYSHVRIRYRNAYDQSIIFEARGNGIRFVGPIAASFQDVIVCKEYTILANEDEFRLLEAICFQYAGLKYGVLQILGIGLANIFGLSKNPFSDGRYSQVCSELVGTILETVFYMHIGKDLDMAGPKEIDEFLSKARHKGVIL